MQSSDATSSRLRCWGQATPVHSAASLIGQPAVFTCDSMSGGRVRGPEVDTCAAGTSHVAFLLCTELCNFLLFWRGTCTSPVDAHSLHQRASMRIQLPRSGNREYCITVQRDNESCCEQATGRPACTGSSTTRVWDARVCPSLLACRAAAVKYSVTILFWPKNFVLS